MILRIETKLVIPTKAIKYIEEISSIWGTIEYLDSTKVFQLSCDDDTDIQRLKKQCREIFCDPILEEIHFENWRIERKERNPSFVIDIRYRAGVTDNIGRSAEEAFGILGSNVRVATGTLYTLYGEITEEHSKRIAFELLANDLIQDIHVYSWQDFLLWERFSNPPFQVRLKL